MSFRIVINETREVRKMKPREWSVVGKHGEDYQYDFTPEVETIVRENIDRFDSTVEELDLEAVIKAVYRLK